MELIFVRIEMGHTNDYVIKVGLLGSYVQIVWNLKTLRF